MPAITADDPRARFCEWTACGALIDKTPNESWSSYAKRRFCRQACSSAWRLAQPCSRCLKRECCDGQDWYVYDDGRSCRCCSGRRTADRRRANGRPPASPRPRPLAVARPAVDVIWRPEGWPAQPRIPAFIPPIGGAA